MPQASPPIILFTYPESVVGRRTEWYLTLRGIPYYKCRVDTKMPRPVLERLGVYYRRIPILAIGREMYCDSRCIIARLEKMYTGVPPMGAQEPYERGIERIIENWAFDGGLFARTAQMIPADASLVLSKEWLADRAELTGVKFDGEGLKAGKATALAHARLHLQIVEEDLMADGREWLSGRDQPGLGDVHVLWIFDWMFRPKERMGMRHAYPDLLNDKRYPKVFAWVKRMDQAFQAARTAQGVPQDLSDDEVVQMIESSTYWEPDGLEFDDNDPIGLEKGTQTDLIALDSSPKTGVTRRDVGALVGLTVTSATVLTQTKQNVPVRIHYQRNNVRVAKAEGGPRLAANEIPKL